jgi:prepilin-type N-terminal cleavage/methylation domain-containing protein/prepilin-type processing-associated H-X9-DG protein
MASASYPRRCRQAFTLVELLVVIGIIAILISVLLPTLTAARRSAYKAKCLSNMRQLGDAYKLYQLDNKGYWPPAWIQYKRTVPPGAIGARCDKRWFDFVGKYVVGGMINKQDLNWNGTQLASLEPQIWSEPVWHSDNAIWGCPLWERVGRDSAGNVSYVEGGNAIFWPGYLQNRYPAAPKTTPQLEILDETNPTPRGFTRYTQWTRQSERALLFEAVSHAFSPGSTTWPYKPENASGQDWPKTPSLYFPIDFNRHGRYKTGNKYNDQSLNMLFCDGHATTVSAREAWKAIRFN